MIKFLLIGIIPLIFLANCAVNPATGRNQFTGLMSVQSEAQVGANEHQKVIQKFGLYDDQALQQYISEIGARIVPHTERGDVRYQFFLLDSEAVNAFALPGGYIYVTRGLLALANSEAELAAVIAHEIGHVTGRHGAERYSRGVVTSLGTAVLGAAIDKPDVSKVINTGANLYMKSYSRSQENEADQLGIRYLARAGYDPFAMSRFMQNLNNEAQLQQKLTGKRRPPAFLSTHPDSGDRAATSTQIAGSYSANPNATINRNGYLRKIKGLTFGDAGKEGFIKDQSFIHPEIGFKYTLPPGFETDNRPDKVVSTGPNNTAIIFDFDTNTTAFDPQSYLQGAWMRQEPIGTVERISVNGLRGATAMYASTVRGIPFTIRLVAIEWKQNTFARFHIAYPQNAPASFVTSLRDTTYSFSRLSSADKSQIKAERIEIVTARPGDSAASLARRQPYGTSESEARFRVLNGLGANEDIKAGELYKLVVR